MSRRYHALLGTHAPERLIAKARPHGYTDLPDNPSPSGSEVEAMLVTLTAVALFAFADPPECNEPTSKE
jgi:hypothetical protein